MEMIQELMETNKSGDDTAYSHMEVGRALHFPTESCSCGLIAGMSALFVLTQLPPGSWLHANWRFSFWRLASGPPANQSEWLVQVNTTYFWMMFTVRPSEVKVIFQKHFSSGQAPPIWGLFIKTHLCPWSRTLNYITSSLSWDWLLSPSTSLHHQLLFPTRHNGLGEKGFI